MVLVAPFGIGVRIGVVVSGVCVVRVVRVCSVGLCVCIVSCVRVVIDSVLLSLVV